jgi:DNA ligase (NAD+)
LEKRIRKARKAYYDGEPTMSDSAFDKLMDKLRATAPTSRVLAEVGAKPAGSTGEHTIPMGSLKEAKTAEEMEAWMRGDGRGAEGGFLVMAKVDGLSVALDYVSGTLRQALTRGNGRVGEDVTANVLLMKNVREEIPGFNGTLRGEAFLPVQTFNEKYAEDYANPRNTAAGIVRRHSGVGAEDVALRYFYLQRSDAPGFFDSRSAMLSYMKALDLLPVDSFRVVNIKQLEVKWASVVELRHTRYYEMDGVVVYVDRFDDREQGDPFLPDDALVWKFAPDVAVTTVTQIENVAGRSGRVNPRVHVNPVKVGGVTVTHATGNNYPWLKNLGVGVDARVEVSRRGDTIPAVESVLEKGKALRVPKDCPSCESILVVDGAYLKCKNLACEAKDSGKVSRWLELLEIKGVGKKMLAKLVDLGIKRPYQLYGQKLEFWTDNFGKNGRKILQQLLDKKIVKPELVLASHVSNVGRRRFRAILDAGISLEAILDADEWKLETVDGIGGGVAGIIVKGFQHEAGNVRLLLNHIKTEVTMSKGGSLEGTALKFTGKMSMKRAELEEIAENRGARIGWKAGFTNVLVIADPTSQSAKAKAARAKGHELISEEEFMKRAGT